MNRKNGARVIRIAGIVVGVAFLCIGLGKGQAMDTLMKAVQICLECIGIG